MSKTYGIKECANPACSNRFEAKRINMVYCCSDCCKQATNAKLIERYHANKNKSPKERRCARCNGRLSRYNPDDECGPCQSRKSLERRTALLAELGIEYIEEN